MGKEHTISKWSKLDIDEFKFKQDFAGLSGPQSLPSNKAYNQKPGYKQRVRVANKHIYKVI